MPVTQEWIDNYNRTFGLESKPMESNYPIPPKWHLMSEDEVPRRLEEYGAEARIWVEDNMTCGPCKSHLLESTNEQLALHFTTAHTIGTIAAKYNVNRDTAEKILRTAINFFRVKL